MKSELAKRITALSPEQRRVLQQMQSSAVASAWSEVPVGAAPLPAPASSNQEYIWGLDRRNAGNPGWNVFTGARFTGPLNQDAIQSGLQEIIRRHEALRTSFRMTDTSVLQVVEKEMDVPLPVVDLQDCSPQARAGESKAQVTRFYRQTFDLTTPPLVRPVLFRLAENEHQLLVIMHHTITDWVSFGILNRELAALYPAFLEGRASPLPAPAIQYRDYAAWEKAWERSEMAQQELDYWRKALEGIPELMRLPWKSDRPAVQTFNGARHLVTVTAETSEALRRFGRSSGITLFVVTLTVFQILLAELSGSEDVVVGSPVIGRKPKGSEHAIGLFLNHLALRTEVKRKVSFRNLLARVHETVLAAYARQQLPFGRLVRELRPAASAAYTPLFQVSFFFLSVPPIQTLAGLTWSNLEAYGETSRYDLLLSLWDKPEGVSGILEYNTDLFDEERAGPIAAAIEKMLDQLVKDFDQPVDCLSAIAAQTWSSTWRRSRDEG